VSLSSLVITVAPFSFINTLGATLPPHSSHRKMGSLDAYSKSNLSIIIDLVSTKLLKKSKTSLGLKLIWVLDEDKLCTAQIMR